HDDHGAEEAAADGHHDDDHGHAEDAKADDHDDHGHEDHADAEQGHDDHDHGDHDPHAWLAPSNASAWLNLIAAKLSAADPDNAGAYFANAAAGQAELERLAEDVRTLLAPVESGSFIVFHDAYQYFETDFDVTAAGAISLGDAAEPSPARITEIQARVQETGVTCILSEPQYNANLVSTVLDGTEVGTGVIDPLGVTMELGPELYPQLIRNMATTLANCG
ncbi:MAG: zinc ABC transporter substrate-binding protein, partial [Pseudomonadota bacterium]